MRRIFPLVLLLVFVLMVPVFAAEALPVEPSVALSTNEHKIYAMPPHPDLEQKIQEGKIESPYFIKYNKELRQMEVDQPVKILDVSKLPFSKNAQSLESNEATSTSTRTYRILTVLIDFSDKTASTPASFFDPLVYNSTGVSVRSYYLENSYGILDIVTVNLPSSLGWQRAPQNYSWYVNNKNGFGSYPQNSKKLTEDIVDAIDPVVNFADYDNDGDGDVDSLILVHAGPGAEFTGNSNDMWSHSWYISPRLKDGKYIRNYIVVPEYEKKLGNMHIGAFAHELGHAFGLLDLYDTDYSSKGIGKWSLMSYGCWNGLDNVGSSPAHLDAWSKEQAGFLTPELKTGTVLIPNAEMSSAGVFKVLTNISCEEYFLVENRQKIGFDSYLPGDGLLIWHIDESEFFYGNTHEWYPGHTSNGNYLVALEQADGLWEMEKNISFGNSGDPYPGSTLNHNFNLVTTPDSKGYSGADTLVRINGISDSGYEMTANISCPSVCLPPPFCNDGYCNGNENYTTCPIDCPPPVICGQYGCQLGENCSNCPQDCDVCPYCGDHICQFRESLEDCSSCPADCGTCPACTLTANVTTRVGPFTNNLSLTATNANECQIGCCDPPWCLTPGYWFAFTWNCSYPAVSENTVFQASGYCRNTTTNWYTNCYLNITALPPPRCGDGSCNGAETCPSCITDCCPAVCGQYGCQLGETCSTCPQDCGTCTCRVRDYCADVNTVGHISADCKSTTYSCGTMKCCGGKCYKGSCPTGNPDALPGPLNQVQGPPLDGKESFLLGIVSLVLLAGVVFYSFIRIETDL